jgi:ribosomal protein S18 acetylase RimI-like enzyme
MTQADVRIVVVDGEEALALAEQLTHVYRRAFGAPGYDEPEESVRRFHDEQLPKHATRDGFRCAIARSSDQVIGFGYGYTGQRGQWWSDWVAERAPAEVVQRWLGGHFEFVELAVDPAEHGHGVGTALHDALLAGLSHEVALLTTYGDDRAAVRLYRRKGWQLLVRRLDDDSDLYGLDLRSASYRKTGVTSGSVDVG